MFIHLVILYPRNGNKLNVMKKMLCHWEVGLIFQGEFLHKGIFCIFVQVKIAK